jgi:hypothetical protein
MQKIAPNGWGIPGGENGAKVGNGWHGWMVSFVSGGRKWMSRENKSSHKMLI